jgi:hypothetical protein
LLIEESPDGEKKLMTTFTLKLIAIIAMLIDHIGAIFIPGNTVLYLIFRSIGRIAFPIFVFLIVEGFYHTSNIKRYLMRLGLFALISEIPFDLAFYQYLFRSNVIEDLKQIYGFIAQGKYDYEYHYFLNTLINRLLYHQNVFFTLFLGLLMITIMNKAEHKFEKKIEISFLLDGLLILSFGYIAYFLKTDYDYAGIILIAAFYLFRGKNLILTISLLIVNGIILSDHGQITISVLAALAMFFIYYYNGKKGKEIKYLFYLFYPLHLAILFLIKALL